MIEMIVIVDGKEQRREVDQRTGMRKPVPVLRPGEEVIETVGAAPVIVQTVRQ